MRYQGEKFADGAWQPITATCLPAWLKNKKAVVWASRGTELARANSAGTSERYRLVKRD